MLLKNKLFIINLLLIVFLGISYKNLSASENSCRVEISVAEEIFYDFQPVLIGVVLWGNSDNEVYIGKDDWYNNLGIIVTPYKRQKDYDTFGNIVRKRVKEEVRNVTIKIIEGEELIDGTIEKRVGKRPHERKLVTIELLDEGGGYFKDNYTYEVYVGLDIENVECSADASEFTIIKPVTLEQKQRFTFQLGAKALEEGNYELALKNFEEYYRVEKEITQYPGHGITNKIIEVCEKKKDNYCAKKYALKGLAYSENDRKRLKKSRKEKYKKLVLKKGAVIDYDEFAKQEVQKSIIRNRSGIDWLENAKGYIKYYSEKIKKYDELINKQENKAEEKRE